MKKCFWNQQLFRQYAFSVKMFCYHLHQTQFHPNPSSLFFIQLPLQQESGA
ncbi:hypothetical protein [Calothrix sp. UHCC 0171]|uniref:hypothetical protein n=1 Tax=Calothrix sp. UHCC 0171 TaxID=3110245 RepID=UPI002B220A69|nr:hypothetical protein [Calothrix sp. UHCC 0171]MEA5571372.1 hypothetical protein [Calothrix sp. UHCC 0171]